MGGERWVKEGILMGRWHDDYLRDFYFLFFILRLKEENRVWEAGWAARAVLPALQPAWKRALQPALKRALQSVLQPALQLALQPRCTEGCKARCTLRQTFGKSCP